MKMDIFFILALISVSHFSENFLHFLFVIKHRFSAKVVPFDEFYYQLKLMYLFLLHVVYTG
jgi:hypothetical protein